MSLTLRIVLAAGLAALAACGESRGPAAGADAPALPDAPTNVRLPTWMLEDIQPQSPRAGQTYGLDTFGGKVVVVTLVEGF